jgi:hypothetical protein
VRPWAGEIRIAVLGSWLAWWLVAALRAARLRAAARNLVGRSAGRTLAGMLVFSLARSLRDNKRRDGGGLPGDWQDPGGPARFAFVAEAFFQPPRLHPAGCASAVPQLAPSALYLRAGCPPPT